MLILSRKEQCKELMTKFFGPATASLIDNMDDVECVQKCREKVASFLDEEKAKEIGVSALLMKPIERSKLSKVLKKILDV